MLKSGLTIDPRYVRPATCSRNSVNTNEMINIIGYIGVKNLKRVDKY